MLGTLPGDAFAYQGSKTGKPKAVSGDAAQTQFLTQLQTGFAAVQAKQSAAAVEILKPLQRKSPKLGDYAAWLLAQALFDTQQYSAVAEALEPVFGQSPASPLVGRSAILAARSYLQSANAHAAVDVLRKQYRWLPQPAGDLLLASALASDNDLVSAAVYDQRVYYSYPMSAEAAQADADLAVLRNQLGDRYPPALGNQLLNRATKLVDATQIDRTQAERARKDLQTAIQQLAGEERDVARVKLGVVDYHARDYAGAQRYFSSLMVEAPEADAERIYYLFLCARRANRRDDANELLDELAREYPLSKWRLEALISAAYNYLTENQVDAYEPLYRNCYAIFPSDPRAAECHWKVTWAHYLHRNADALDMMREHLRRFPGSDNAPGALYYLGRAAENGDDPATAKTFYEEIIREYPNSFYAAVARDRRPTSTAGSRSSAANEFLQTVQFPQRVRTRNFKPNGTAKARIERARLLIAADLYELAEGELRYAAQNEDQPHVMALQLALAANRKVGPDQALRYLKRYASDYLYLPLESAPVDFWRLAFPLPYRADLERFAKENNVDPYLLAALIRQESEFNPKAVSRADARGLTQIMPATGKELSQRLQMKGYSTPRLFTPAVNLQLGSFYLKLVADKLSGRWEAALAAYNAGLTRANNWSTWSDFREPAEFMETVPFRETRNYVEIVLRNAYMYRRIYAGDNALIKAPRNPVMAVNADDSGDDAVAANVLGDRFADDTLTDDDQAVLATGPVAKAPPVKTPVAVAAAPVRTKLPVANSSSKGKVAAVKAAPKAPVGKTPAGKVEAKAEAKKPAGQIKYASDAHSATKPTSRNPAAPNSAK